MKSSKLRVKEVRREIQSTIEVKLFGQSNVASSLSLLMLSMTDPSHRVVKKSCLNRTNPKNTPKHGRIQCHSSIYLAIFHCRYAIAVKDMQLYGAILLAVACVRRFFGVWRLLLDTSASGGCHVEASEPEGVKTF